MHRRRPVTLRSRLGVPLLALTAMLGILVTMLWLAVVRPF